MCNSQLIVVHIRLIHLRLGPRQRRHLSAACRSASSIDLQSAINAAAHLTAVAFVSVVERKIQIGKQEVSTSDNSGKLHPEFRRINLWLTAIFNVFDRVQCHSPQTDTIAATWFEFIKNHGLQQ